MCAYSVFNTFPVYPLSAKPLILLAFCRYRYHTSLFDRPDLNRMIKDAMEDTRPTGIMVKDMSRFGRNNAMFMYYVEEIFPNNDILFIALNDDVDTRFDENEMMPFKSIMNEYYARDTSKKIRSVKKTMALNGGFCGSFAPYGYMVCLLYTSPSPRDCS